MKILLCILAGSIALLCWLGVPAWPIIAIYWTIVTVYWGCNNAKESKR